MSDVSLCINIPIYPDMGTELYFTLTREKIEVPPEELVLEVELPSALIASCSHAAKATEEAVEAINRGVSLRNRRLEVLRRLLVRKQIKDVEKFLEVIPVGTCYAYVTRSAIEARVIPCNFNERAIDLIMEEEPNLRSLGEQALIAAIALSSTGRWIG
ncbi:MAG: hypothetical protein ACPLSO_06230 [Fervidicoccaceae archaeon]